MPITLAYHASGVKLHEFPGWVGLGWALNAGGEIRRRLQGLPDEQPGSFIGGNPLKANDIYPGYTNDLQYLQLLFKGSVDNGADIFSFNYPGGDGKFFFDRDNGNQPVLLPYMPVKVNRLDSFASTYFTIQDPHGNLYQFGKDVLETSTSYSYPAGSPTFNTSAWMLETMISSSKADTISFTYQTQIDRSRPERHDTWVVEDMVDDIQTVEIDPYYPKSDFTANFTVSEMYSANNQEIRFKNGKVVFELDAGKRQDFGITDVIGKALKRIKIYSTGPGGDKLLKSVTFFYGYFSGGANSQRLRLDSLQMVDAAATAISTHRFQYDTTVNLPALDEETLCKDFWGYYNGKVKGVSNVTLVPHTSGIYYKPLAGNPFDTTITIGSSTAGSREPDSVYMQAAVLKRVVYPGKGYTDFEYETNRYLDSTNTVALSGGLRIKSMKSYDGYSSVPVTKTFKYGHDESGNGRANYFIDRKFFFDEQNCLYHKRFNDAPNTTPYQVAAQRRRTYYESPSIDIHPFDGSPVVYPVVTEYFGEGSNVLGKTVYRFRDTLDGMYGDVPNSSKGQVASHFYARGQLADKKTYKKMTTGGFQPVEEEQITYNTTSFPSVYKFGGLVLKQMDVMEGLEDLLGPSNQDDYYYNNYIIHTDDSYPVSNTQRTFDPDDSTKYVETVTSMYYGNFAHQQPNSITTTNSRGETQVTQVRYPADYIASGTLTGNAVLDSMLAKNMQAVEIEKWLTLTKPSQSGKVTAGILSQFKQLSNGLIVPDKQSRLLVAAPLSSYQTGSISAGLLQTDSHYGPAVHYNLFDHRGNILETQRSNGIKEAYLWSYGGTLPVAKIVGSDYSTVKQYVDTALLYSSGTTEQQIRAQLATLRSALSSAGALVSTYTYKPLVGLSSETDPAGRTTYYEYDAAGRLVLMRDQNFKILKKICYNYAGQVENCAPACDSVGSGWQNTSTAVRCRVISGSYTGEQEQEQVDLSPCSASYGNVRWLVIGTNNTACPAACGYANCTGNGPQYKCVSGTCEEGVKVYTTSYYDGSKGYVCVYHYEWSDDAWSTDYEETSPFGYPCIIF